MSVKLSLRIAAVLLGLHGLVELLGIFTLFQEPSLSAATFANFGGMDSQLIAQQLPIVILLGVVWGISRWVALVAVWHNRRWGVIFGGCLALVSLIAGISIIPAGLLDTLLAAPTLGLLLYAWFGKQTLA